MVGLAGVTGNALPTRKIRWSPPFRFFVCAAPARRWRCAAAARGAVRACWKKKRMFFDFVLIVLARSSIRDRSDGTEINRLDLRSGCARVTAEPLSVIRAADEAGPHGGRLTVRASQ